MVGLPNLLAAIGGVFVGYGLFLKDKTQRRMSALRIKSPEGPISDSSDYGQELRPGAMISCGNDGDDELLATSGVMVRDKSGEEFITAAPARLRGHVPSISHTKGRGWVT